MKVKRLPSGRYHVQVVLGYDENGKRIVKSITKDTEWEVRKEAEELKMGFIDSRELNVPVEIAMRRYLESRKTAIEPTTYRNYDEIIRNRLKLIKSIKLRDLRTGDIQKAINADSEHLSPKSVKNSFAFLKSTLDFFDCDLRLNKIVIPKVRKKSKELPNVETIFRIFKGTSSELPVLLASWLSLREGEVLGLRFKDINKERKTIKIQRTLVRGIDGFQIREGCKTEGSTRELQLPDYIYSLIESIPHNNDDERIINVSRNTLYKKYKAVLAKHGLEMTFHDLRHLNASVMLMLGIPDKYAMERGGWSTDHVMKSVYQHTISDERARVDDAIDSYFNEIIELI